MSLLCKLGLHTWRVTHRNPFQIDVRRECTRCGRWQEHRWPPGSGWRWQENCAPKPITPAELAVHLDVLADQMADLGEEMMYVGGFGKTGCRGSELIHIACSVAGWARDIRAEIEEKEGQ